MSNAFDRDLALTHVQNLVGDGLAKVGRYLCPEHVVSEFMADTVRLVKVGDVLGEEGSLAHQCGVDGCDGESTRITVLELQPPAAGVHPDPN